MANQRFELILFNDPAQTYALLDEPVKWDQLLLKRNRDKTYHGLNYLFSDGDIPVEFDDDAGKQHIEYAYSVNGPNADVRLRWYQTTRGIESLREVFKLDLVTMKWVDDRLQINLTRPTLHDTIKANWDTDLDLTSRKTLTGTPIDTAPLSNLRLHSQELQNGYAYALKEVQTVDYNLVQAEPVGSSLSSNSYEFWVSLPTENPTLSDLPENFPTSLNVTSNDPVNDSLCWFRFADRGTLTVNINFSVEIDVRTKKRGLVLGNVRVNKWYYEPIVLIKPKTGDSRRILIGAPNVPVGGEVDHSFGHVGPQTVTGTYQETISVAPGDELYLFVHLAIQADKKCDLEFKLSCPKLVATLDAKTTQESSVALSISYPDAVKQALLIITGQSDILRTDDYLAAEWVNYELLSGFALRGFVDKPLTTSLKKLADAALTLFAAGNGYETDSAGKQVFRMARWDYFYGDQLLLDLPDVADDWGQDVAGDYLYAGVDVGYTKYPDSGIGVLDDPHTLHQYATPTVVVDNRFNIQCPFIGSGYALETTRREQFRDKPADSTSYDDNVFIVATLSSSYTGTIGVTGGNGSGQIVLSGNAPDWIKVGVKLQIIGSRVNTLLYTVAGIGTSIGVRNLINVLGPHLTLEYGIRTLIAPEIGRQAERDEAFAQVTGTVAPTSLFNLRITPGRMLYNWGRWLKSSLYYHRLGESLTPTFIKNNGALTTQLLPGDNRPMGDLNRQVITEKAAIYLAQWPEPVFQPEYVTLSWVEGESVAQALDEALDGQGPARYGYIRAALLRQTISGWPITSQYEPTTGKLQLTLLKKAVISARQHTPTPGECADFATWTLDMFAQANPRVPDWILSCIFDVFA